MEGVDKETGEVYDRGPLIEQRATLHSIGDGSAAEKFQAELKKVWANIQDPNTEADDRRQVTLTFQFIPTKDREQVAVLISAKSSLPAMKPSSDVMYLGRKNGEIVGTVVHPQQDPRQGILPLEGKAVANGGI